MKKIMLTLLAIGSLGLVTISAQVTSTKYIIDFNCESNYYDVKLLIEEGSASSTLERVQFNSQMCIVVPTGEGFEIMENHAPFVNNQQLDSDLVTEWQADSPVVSPIGHEEYDFYTIAPKLSPASFYNEVEEGEEILIFSFRLDDTTTINEQVRLFDNATDPAKSNYEGSDLRNGFSIGGASNSYSGNIHRSCLTSTKSINGLDIQAYPNPATDKIMVPTPKDTQSIQLIDSSGRKIKSIKKPSKGITAIDVDSCQTGMYFLTVVTNDQIGTQRLSIIR